jgi:hypothetical protein
MSDSAITAQANPARVLVWCAWGCVAYFLVGWAVLKDLIPVPEKVAFFFLLSGAVVALGGVLALLFLLVAARSSKALVNGLAAFVANVGLFVFFMYALPG